MEGEGPSLGTGMAAKSPASWYKKAMRTCASPEASRIRIEKDKDEGSRGKETDPGKRPRRDAGHRDGDADLF